MANQLTAFITLMVACIFATSNVRTANILAVFPVAGKSHWISLKPLLKELDKRGHAITVITPYQEKDVSSKWKTILVPEEMKSLKHFSGLRKDVVKTSQSLSPFAIHKMVMSIGLMSCEELFSDDAIQEMIKTNENKFDLLIIEYFMHNCFLAFAHKFQIPVIGMTPSSGFLWMMDMVGNPTPPSYISDGILDYTDHMDFYERLHNIIVSTYSRYTYYYEYVSKADDLVKKYFKDTSIPSILDLGYNTSLLIIMSHTSFTYPRPLLPNVIEAGGMHVEPPKALPEDLQKFLDNAKDGVIYFSMGSNFRTSDLPSEMISNFMDVFSKLKQHVLWKWEKDTMPGKPSNIKLGKWFPQSDILAHKNVRAFITHGGLQSTIEATSRGVPMIAIPVTADQKFNAARSSKSGYCVKIDLINVTTQSLEWALSEILDNPKYWETAQLKSRLFHDRPQKPLETAVYWTEYVLRHNGAPHLHSAALDLTWYQYLLLDVIALLIIVTLSLSLLFVFTIRSVLRWVIDGKPTAHSAKKTKPIKKEQ